MRFLRPLSVSSVQSVQFIDLCFACLTQCHGVVQRRALVVLIDHLGSCIHQHSGKRTQILEWACSYVNGAVNAKLSVDPKLLSMVIASFQSIIRLGGDRPNLHQITSSFISLAITALRMPPDDVSLPLYITIASQAIRQLVHLIDPAEPIQREIASQLTELRAAIPDDVRFFRVSQNFLLLMCGLFSRQSELPTLFGMAIETVFQAIQLFLHPPFAQSLRTRHFLERLVVICNSQKTFAFQRHNHLFARLWLVATNLDATSELVRASTDLIQVFISAEFFRTRPGMQIDFLEQSISALELLRADVEVLRPTMMFDVWIDIQLRMIRIVAAVMGQGEVIGPDWALIDVFARLFRYFAWILNLGIDGTNPVLVALRGQMPPRRFRDKLLRVLQAFAKDFVLAVSRIPSKLALSLLLRHLIVLIPTRPHHIFHKSVHDIFMQSSHATIYHYAFFETMTRRFKDLCSPSCQPLVDLTRLVFVEAFVKQVDVNGQLPPLVHGLVLRIFEAKDILMIEIFVCCVFEAIIRAPRKPQLLSLATEFKKDQFSFVHILKAMADDMKSETVLGFLALLIFFILQPSSDEHLESWIILFLLALESPTQFASALAVFYQCFSRNFAQVFDGLRDPFQLRLITALALALPRSAPREVGWIKVLLAKIPVHAARYLTFIHEERQRGFVVSVDGVDLALDLVFAAIKREPTPTEEQLTFLFVCFVEFMRTLSFFDAIGLPIVHQISEYLAQRVPDQFNALHRGLTGPSKYAALVLLQRAGVSVEGIISEMNDVSDFVKYITISIIDSSAMLAMLKIIGFLIPRVLTGPLLLRVSTMLIRMGQINTAAVMEILDSHILSRQFSGQAELDIAVELYKQYRNLLYIQNKKLRRIAHLVLSRLQQWVQVRIPQDETRKILLRDALVTLQQQPPQNVMRLQQLFDKPFDDVAEPLSMISRLLQVFIGLTQPQLTRASRAAVAKFGKVDPSMSAFFVARFILKFIARLFPYVPASKNSHQQWDQIMASLRDPKRSHMLPFFVKQLKRVAPPGGFVAISGDIIPQVLRPQHTHPPPEDVLIVRFLVRHSSAKDHQHHLVWITKGMRAYQQMLTGILEPHGRAEAEQALAEFLRFFRTMNKIKDFKVDQSALQMIVDLVLFVRANMVNIEIPHHLIPRCYPDLSLECLMIGFQRGWSFDLFALLIAWLTHSACFEFRVTVMAAVKEHSKEIMKYVEEKISKDFQQLVLLKAFHTLDRIYCEYAPEQIDIALLFPVAKLLFVIWFTDSEKQNMVLIRPSFLLALCHVLFPLRFINRLNADDSLFHFFRSEVYSILLQAPAYFSHPFFIRQFTAFANGLSAPRRDALFEHVLSWEPDGFWGTLLQNQIRAARSPGSFTPTSPPEYSHSPFSAFLLCHSDASSGFSPTARITNLCACPLLHVSAECGALALRERLPGFTLQPTVARVCHASNFLMTHGGDSDLSPALFSLLTERPFAAHAMQVAMLAVMQQRAPAKDPWGLLRFAVGYATATLSRDPQYSVLGSLPSLFLALHCTSVERAAPRVLEILLTATEATFSALSEKVHYAHEFPPVIRLWAPSVRRELIDRRLIGGLRRLLVKPLTEQTPLRIARLRFVFEFVPPLARALFEAPLIISDLLPSNFIALTVMKDLLVGYKDALAQIIAATGVSAASWIVRDIFERVAPAKKLSLSQPRASPFATVCQWITEITDEHVLPFVRVLVDVFKPRDGVQLLADAADLRPPLHIRVLKILAELFAGELRAQRQVAARAPVFIPATIGRAKNIATAVWTIDWWAIPTPCHSLVLARMLLPNAIALLAYRFGDIGLAQIIVVAISQHFSSIARFALFYVAAFPQSTLTDALSIAPAFDRESPWPNRSLCENLALLERMNLADDSIGITKMRKPSLRSPASLHQLGLFAAATHTYLIAMDENPNSYFDALLRLRSCVVNATFPRTPDLREKIIGVIPGSSCPLITLPCSQGARCVFEFTSARPQDLSKHPFTTFRSSAFLPFLLTTAISDEVYQMVKLLMPQQQNINLPELTRSTSALWLHALDKQMLLASSLAWRLSIWGCVADPIQAQTEVQEALAKNRRFVARLLSRAGAINDCIHPTPDRVPRAYQKSVGAPLSFALRIALCDFSIVDGKWLTFAIALNARFPRLLDPALVFSRALAEMKTAPAKHRTFLGALALALIRREPALSARFALAAPQLSEDCRRFWISYLPALIAICPAPPLQFLQTLIQSSPWQIMLLILHFRNTGAFTDGAYVRDLMNTLKATANERIFHESDALFAFARKEEDIHRLAFAVGAHESLACRRAGFDAPTVDIAELAAFCEANPPVFIAVGGVTDFNSLTTVKLFMGPQPIFRVALEADGAKEATLRFITFRGESKNFIIAAARIYRFTLIEAILVQAVGRVAAKHPASAGIARPLHYPFAYRIHKQLVLFECTGVATFREIIPPIQIVRALDGNPVEIGFAPKSNVERQTHRCQPGKLREWFVRGIDGSKSNFLFMRAAFAASIAAAAAMHEMFGSNGFEIAPFMFANDRQRVFEPAFVAQKERTSHFLPLTNQIVALLPRFVLEGSFTTAWNTLVTGMADKIDKIRVVLTALLPEKDETFVEDVERRIEKLAVKIVEGEPTDTYFPFDLIEHMIDNSNNVWKAQTKRFGWL